MVPSIAVDLRFRQFFTSHHPGEVSAYHPPLFLATDGVHGVVNVAYSDAPQASYSTDIIKICLYGMCIKCLSIEADLITKCQGKLHISIPAGPQSLAGTPRSSAFRMSVCTI
jgi:hypothetical protein